MSDLPRGIRLHNPGNIRKGDRWKGLDTPSDDGSFCRFKSAPYGIRALAVVLETYQDRRLAADGSAIDTVREVVERWAPPVENDTESYIHSVRQATGFKPGQHIDVHDFDTAMALCKAIIRHENGSQPYSDAELAKGLHLAGIEAPHAPLKKSRTITGAQVAGGATVLGMAGEYADQASALVPAAGMVFDFFKSIPLWVLGVLALAAVVLIVKARMDDRGKGLR